MNQAYKRINEIWNKHFQINEPSVLTEIIELLAYYQISLRKKNGYLKQITVSIPSSIEDSYVVGLRYIKLDGSPTEDHFLCRKSGNGLLKKKLIEYHPKRKLELLLPEYKGTHKQWVDFDKLFIQQCNTKLEYNTDVSTISYIINGS